MSNEISYYDLVFSKFITVKNSIQHLNDIVLDVYLKYSESESKRIGDEIDAKKFPDEDITRFNDLVKSEPNTDFQTMLSKLDKFSPDAFKSIADVVKNTNYWYTTESFLRKMSIVHLITEFEEFLKQTLGLIFLNKPESLKSNQQISFTEIMETSSYEEIIQKIISRKTKEIIDQNPLDLEADLTKYFDFQLENDTLWQNVKEVFYRRHALVHNNGHADDEYKSKTKNYDEDDLSPTKEYVHDSLDSFLKFAETISSNAKIKFPQNMDQLNRFNLAKFEDIRTRSATEK